MIEWVEADLRDARRARDAARVQTLGSLLAALKGAQKEAGGTLDEPAAIAVLRRERKRRAEGALIDAYMPAALADDELERMVRDAVAESGASSPREMGAVMKLLTPRVAGRADGRTVSEAVKRALAG